MTLLADNVLPLIRTRADLHRWSAANGHGDNMHTAIDILEAALPTTDPFEAHNVVHAALGSAIKVIARADDSSGIIGDACRRLLALHPTTAAASKITPTKLVDWMIKFQFHGEVDYFELDPVAYSPALGIKGMQTYRQQLDRTLKNSHLAWEHRTTTLDPANTHVWAELANAYEHVDPAAVLPIHRRLVENELLNTDAKHYRNAAKRLAKMRKLAAATEHQTDIDTFITELRNIHRRRPRLQQEFDRAKLPNHHS